jgi:7-cyano-7-deazaguanine synthase in queuosine biosynthesis
MYKKGMNHRPTTQYGAMAQVTINLGRRIELGVENSEHSTMRAIVKDDLIYDPQLATYRIKSREKIMKNREKWLFAKFDYPIIQYTKEDMYREAKRDGYEDILKKTWSCWFPKGGRPCNKCPMCRERLNMI